ncbi:hypothetical protein [Gillisia sp. CAL575]|uniref:hypothetical protein n=1 Tax=Gillisia sp. CAL575 TaxID=985255 RepID=UPI00039FB36E|nr:hypothetical protein [Gillisia sp. CAL575]
MYKTYLLIFSTFLISLSTFSQNYSKEKLYSWYDQQTGIENSILFRGVEYVETDRMINEKHKFFESQKFQNGSLTYDGQLFFKVPLKYNVYDDLILVNLQNDGANTFFQLFSGKVNQFQINEHKFRFLKADNNLNIKGFYEVINQECQLKIFKKHLKNRMEIRDRSVAYTEFSVADPHYIFQFKNDFFELANRRDLLAQFPNLKGEIKNYYSKYRKQYKDNPDIFMNNLADKMNSLISNSKNQI